MADARPALVNPEVMLAVDPPRLRALVATVRAPDVLLRTNPDAVSLARACFVGDAA